MEVTKKNDKNNGRAWKLSDGVESWKKNKKMQKIEWMGVAEKKNFKKFKKWKVEVAKKNDKNNGRV